MSAVLTEFQHSVLWHVMTGKLSISQDYNLSNVIKTQNTTEWFSDIPKHWGSVKLGNYVSLSNGSNSKTKGSYPLYGANGIIGSSNTWNVLKNTLLIGRVGSCGKLFLTPNKGHASDNSLIFQTQLSHKYLFYLLSIAPVDSCINKNAMPLLVGSTLLRLRIPLPPPEERARILAFIEKFTHFIPDSAPAIKALNEWYQSMLFHGLTGGAQ